MAPVSIGLCDRKEPSTATTSCDGLALSFQRHMRLTGELGPGEAAIEHLRERRVRAQVCAKVMLHMNPKKAWLSVEAWGQAPGQEHPLGHDSPSRPYS